jgi:hypothetical protein
MESLLDLQRHLGGNVVLSPGFIGSGGIHLVPDGRNIDQLDPQHLGLGSALNTNVANRGLPHFTSAPP